MSPYDINLDFCSVIFDLCGHKNCCLVPLTIEIPSSSPLCFQFHFLSPMLFLILRFKDNFRTEGKKFQEEEIEVGGSEKSKGGIFLAIKFLSRSQARES